MDYCNSWLWQFLCLLVYRLMPYVSCFVSMWNSEHLFWHWMQILFIITRRFVGVGEASFISLAAPFIDDNAPQKQVSVLHFSWSQIYHFFKSLFVNHFCFQKAAWLGLFYMCIPSGVALGYVYGGYVSYICCQNT